MYLLPYILQKGRSTASVPVWTAWVFLTNGGTQVWKTDEAELDTETIMREYMEPNGFVGCVKGVVGDAVYVEVDSGPGRTCMADFYLLTDFLKKGTPPPASLDIWRPLVWVGEQPGPDRAHTQSWAWDTVAADISLGSFGTIQKFWSGLSALPDKILDECSSESDTKGRK